MLPHLCTNNEFSKAFDPLENLSGQGNIGASQKAYGKLWFAKSKNKLSLFVLSLLEFHGPEIQFKALNCRQKLEILV